ncbi:tyrosine-protein phosphatase [Loigolactobacillus backii]|nr:CpsB/CapC family capsule biosynthesis tyrosine phosphatase [Loigolactobacillus backii]MDA5387546.1 tyrosine protein phosphatase [Loigolactobacillus backii]MDA5390090.1 tyrosine protein phosphatase [Loigolactobacillus backii]
MIDLHCHILPGVDDGSKTMAQSLAMAQVAVENGITHILVTPHHMDSDYTNHKQKVIKHTVQFQQAIDQAKIPLKVFPGQEVHLTGDLLAALDQDDILFADTGNRYLMLEFPHQEVPAYAQRMIFDLQARNIIPVIVHPERNQGIQADPTILYDLVASGCLTQLTASSYLGVFGDEIMKFMQQIIDAGLGFVFASDAHNLKGRNFRMKRAFDKLRKENGQELVDTFQNNAKAIINGDLIVPTGFTQVAKKKKRFWLF